MIQRYRAWDNVKKEMFKDTFAITEIGQVVVVEQKFVTSSPDYVFVDNLVIMQSTGLKDEFDKELFEGDIIEWSYWDEFEDSGTAKIIFDKGMFKLLDVRTEKASGIIYSTVLKTVMYSFKATSTKTQSFWRISNETRNN